mgnify:CR=1 FL=1
MTYYDTTNLREQLRHEEYKEMLVRTKKQEHLIQMLADDFVNKTFSPSMMHSTMERYGRKIPITSVRRAMSDLTKQGILEKTDEQGVGYYGKKEYMWRLV